MSRMITSSLMAVAMIVAFSAGATAADEVTTMPVIEVTLPARILQCIEPRLPETDCVRVCLPTLDNICLEIVKPRKAPSK